ncbi:MAG: hypothetical protein AB8B91_09560 [Rubripirellula sp.]
MRIIAATVLYVGLGFGLMLEARAEKARMTREDNLKTATHVLLGKVVAVYSRQKTIKGWDYTHYLAEILPEKIEKGTGIPLKQPVYVRYWKRRWVGLTIQPPSTNGHRGLPVESDRVRVYLARNAYDGATNDNQDGGLNVIGMDGFEILKDK